MAETDCLSESASSVCDEQRVRRLFQTCDADGDGYIDSHDLLTVCRELCLEDSLDELMLQLGADSQGRISYDQFLQRRRALRPEIEALKGPKLSRDNTSENSQGKLDSWEWDSGARDMSPVPKSIATRTENVEKYADLFKERLQEQLDEQSRSYEEQLTELHSVIAELTRKLHQQRAMAITEEDEISEVCTSVHEDSITCPLEVSELEPAEISDTENNKAHILLAESPLELPEPKLARSSSTNRDVHHHHLNGVNLLELSSYSEIIEPLKLEILHLQSQLADAHTKLAQVTLTSSVFDDTDPKILEESSETEFVENRQRLDSKQQQHQHPGGDANSKLLLDINYTNLAPIHRPSKLASHHLSHHSPPVITKMAERIQLKRASDNHHHHQHHHQLQLESGGDLPTVVAEHIVGDILRQCDEDGTGSGGTEREVVDVELRRLGSRLEHTRAQSSVLALTLNETKAHCDRLALLCGKYESNAIALRLALGVTDRAIEAYDVLLALLETELTLNESVPESLNNRTAAETVAKQLLHHLDSLENTDVLLPPWQNQLYNSPTSENDEPWTTEHENRLREHVSRLKSERSTIQGTYVTLESMQVENVPVKSASSQESRKFDLEMAVLLQELMGLREDKSELLSKLFIMEKEKSAIDVKLRYVDGQQKAQCAALKNLQGQLKDTEGLLVIATQHKERGFSDAEHAQGVEVELMQALAREGRLKVRLQELVTTLEQVTKNAEARLLEGREIVQDLNHTNAILAETVDRNNKKHQARYKKMEHQMMHMVERHAVQVQNLQQRLASIETPTTNSSDNSINSVAV